MTSQSRVLPPHLRRPLPGSGPVHPDSYTSAILPPHGGFPPFEMLPPPEVMEQNISAQHIEIEKLAMENRRFAATHGTLRQDLATARHDLQMVHAHIAEMKAEKEHQTRGIMDQMSMMEAELESVERIKTELQQARSDAQNMVSARKELIAKVQQLTQDLQMSHSEAQQIPALMSELDSLRQEYQRCRATYDYEKKLYHDHLESLQVMERNYMEMTREVDKLRTELTHSTNYDPRTGAMHSGSAGYSSGVPTGSYGSTQNSYGMVQHAQTMIGGGSTSVAVGGPVGVGNATQCAPTGSGPSHDASRVPGYNPARAMDYDTHRAHVAVVYDTQKAHAGAGYDPLRGPTGPGSYSIQRAPTGPAYDAQRWQPGHGYDPQQGLSAPGYDAWRGPSVPGYNAQSAPAYDMQRGAGNDVQSGVNNDTHKGSGYDAPARSAVGHPPQAPLNNASYVSATPTPNTRTGTGTESELVQRSGNPPR